MELQLIIAFAVVFGIGFGVGYAVRERKSRMRRVVTLVIFSGD
jgi:uncharacterized protein YebE (UPF0316 family)